MSNAVAREYTHVTEAPGNRVSRQAIDMLATRYSFAARFCQGKDVLEVACGPGPGLGLLASVARRLVAGDYTQRLVELAHAHYNGRVTLLRLDAQDLPFADGSYDVVLLFEALYYLGDPVRFLRETRRVLRSGGRVIIVSVNPGWLDFNPSPFSTKYFNSEELRTLLEREGFEPELRGTFRVNTPSLRDRAVSGIKRVAVRLGLIPQTMRSKEALKRLFFGRLQPFPAEWSAGVGTAEEPELVRAGAPDREHKVLFAVGARQQA
jgi:SAM-dependent methyltransferase